MNPGIDHDDLSTARDIFNGCILGLAMWAVIAFTILSLIHILYVSTHPGLIWGAPGVNGSYFRPSH